MTRSSNQIQEDMWLRAAAATHRLLMLDYDGTLAPFRVRREEAAPLAGSIELLEEISGSRGTEVAIISGRPLRELERLVQLSGVTLIGEHGFEERSPGGRAWAHPLPEPLRIGIEQATQSAAASGLGERLETKRTSVVLHTRGLEVEDARAAEELAEALWRGVAEASGLRLLRVNGGVELRSPGRDKGVAARDLIDRSPPGTFPVYIGDDWTDEDAFAAVRESGFGIRVGKTRRPTLARGRFARCEAVVSFLAEWRARVEGMSGQGAPGQVSMRRRSASPPAGAARTDAVE